ncbi:DUF1266 domain-containing protein [Streptomyces lydicus]|uniref:DUF1266 domain-containing protein n=1 Tax=Streptomyces lydicus TaxID=47763 RepID=UPI0037AA7480
MVSLDAISAERMWGHSHLMLYPLKRINPTNCQVSLQQSWGVTSSEGRHATLQWLASEGHRQQMEPVIGHPPVAWDFGRYVTVTRLGFGAGYIDEAGAWQLLAIAGRTCGTELLLVAGFRARLRHWTRAVGAQSKD